MDEVPQHEGVSSQHELPQSTPSKMEEIDISEEQEAQQEEYQEEHQEEHQEENAGTAEGQPAQAPEEADSQGGKQGFRATILAGYQSMKKSFPTSALAQGSKTIVTAISQQTATVSHALEKASSAISQQIDAAAQETPNGVLATTVNFSKVCYTLPSDLLHVSVVRASSR
eukprot:1189645-Prorocentrum_minimum.AAC.3